MNIIDLTPTSLLDYVLYSRLLLLQRLLGEDFYLKVFADKPADADSTALHQPGSSIHHPSRVPSANSKKDEVESLIRNCNTEYYGNRWHVSKLKSKSLEGKHGKTKYVELNGQSLQRELRHPTPVSFCINQMLPNETHLRKDLEIKRTINTPKSQKLDRSKSSHCAEECDGSQLLLPSNKKNMVARSSNARREISVPGCSKQNVGEVTLCTFLHRRKPVVYSKQKKPKKPKLSVCSMPCLSKARLDNNVITEDVISDEAAISAAYIPLSEMVELSAGDSVSVTQSFQKRQVSLADTSDGVPSHCNKTFQRMVSKRPVNKRRSRRVDDEVKVCSDLVGADSSSSDVKSPASNVHSKQAASAAGCPLSSQHMTLSIAVDVSESSSYRLVQDTSLQTISHNIPWKTCSEISLPSLPRRPVESLTRTPNSSPVSHQAIPQNNGATNAKNLVEASPIVGQKSEIKLKKLKLATHTRDMSRFPSQFTGLQQAKLSATNSGFRETKSTTQTADATKPLQKSSVPGPDQDLSKIPPRSKELTGKPSLFVGRSSTATTNATSWLDSKPMQEDWGRLTQQTVVEGMQADVISKAKASKMTQPPKLQRGLNSKDLDHCNNCGLGLWKTQTSAPTFFNLTLLLLTFVETNKNHSSTLTKVIESSRTVYGLIEMIKQEQEVASGTIRILKDKSRSYNSVLPHEVSLEECGYEGSSDWYNPVDLTLYYDFDCDYYECPLLISDHYFIQRKRLPPPTNN